MNPATVYAVVQLTELGIQTLQQVRTGNMTDEQAQALLNDACDRVKAAMQAFNDSRGPQEPPASPASPAS